MCGGEGTFLGEHAFTQISLSDGNVAHARPGWHGTASGGTHCPGAQSQGPSTHRRAPSCPQRSWAALVRRAEEDPLAPTLEDTVCQHDSAWLPLLFLGKGESLSPSAQLRTREPCACCPCGSGRALNPASRQGPAPRRGRIGAQAGGARSPGHASCPPQSVPLLLPGTSRPLRPPRDSCPWAGLGVGRRPTPLTSAARPSRGHPVLVQA